MYYTDELYITDSSDTKNCKRVHVTGKGQLCKVYAFSEEDAIAKAEAIVEAFNYRKKMIEFIAKLALNEHDVGDMWNDMYSELARMGIETPEDLDYIDLWKFLAFKYDVLPDYLDEEQLKEIKDNYDW